MRTKGFLRRLIGRRESDDQGSVTRLIIRLCSDDTDDRDQAARLIWQRYFPALLALARDNLRPRILRRENEEDVLQDMSVSFFRRQRRGEFDSADRDALWALLVRITLCKVRNTAKKHGCRKRDINREQPWPAGTEPDASRLELDGIKDRGPTPLEAALLNEAIEQRLNALDNSELRALALKKLEGWTNAEIAASIGRTERSVERKLKMIRECWQDKEPVLIEPADGTPGEGCEP
jgi:RNA polymerase sigma factor (sigma-70 family)